MKQHVLFRAVILLSLAVFLGLFLATALLTSMALAQEPAPPAAPAGQTYWLVLDSARPVDEVLPLVVETLTDLKDEGRIAEFDPTPQASAPGAAQAVKVIAPAGLADLLGSVPGVLAAIDALPPAPPEGLGIQAVTPITGQVTEVVNPTNPIDGIDVDAYDGVTYLWLDDDTTAGGGFYTVLADSPYNQVKLRFYDGFEEYNTEWYDDKPSFNAATAIDTTSGVTITNRNAQLARRGALVGTVVLTPGNIPLEGVHLDLDGINLYADGDADSDANGRFTMTNILSGTHNLEFYNNFNDPLIVEGFYDDKLGDADPTLFTISAAATRTVTVIVRQSAVITGLVTNTVTGAPIPFNGPVVLFDETGDYVADTGTDANGFYQFDLIPGGSYKVYFELGGYNPEFYNDVPGNNSDTGFAQANVVTVTFGQTRTNINAGLTPAGAMITGTVSSFTGTLMPDVYAFLWREDDGEFDFYGYYDATDSSGEYQFTNLQDGVYKVQVGFSDYFGYYDPTIIPHAPEWFNDASVITPAARITITGGISQTGKNVQLALGGCLSGRIVDAETGLGVPDWGFRVRHVENGNEPIPFIYSDFGSNTGYSDEEGQGDFRACGLPAGTYTVDCFSEQLPAAAVTAGNVTNVGICQVNLSKVYLPLIVK